MKLSRKKLRQMILLEIRKHPMAKKAKGKEISHDSIVDAIASGEYNDGSEELDDSDMDLIDYSRKDSYAKEDYIDDKGEIDYDSYYRGDKEKEEVPDYLRGGFEDFMSMKDNEEESEDDEDTEEDPDAPRGDLGWSGRF